MTIHKVFGPPGTGKTTYLLSTVEHELDRGVLPCDIGYFAFTRKASAEARERALGQVSPLGREDGLPSLPHTAFACLPLRSVYNQ
jgi:superfamily I DNA/RNA helicase